MKSIGYKLYKMNPPYNPDDLGPIDPLLPEPEDIELAARLCDRMNELGVPMNEETMNFCHRLMKGEGFIVVTHKPKEANERLILHVEFCPHSQPGMGGGLHGEAQV